MPAPSIARVQDFEGSFSINTSFTPLTANADRGVLVLIGHYDPNSQERNSVSVQYDNTSTGIVEVDPYAFINDGGFPWNLKQVNAFWLDRTFLDARNTTANLSIQNVGDDVIAVVIDLQDVSNGVFDADAETTGSTAAVSTTVVSAAGNVDMDHDVGSARDWAHKAVSIEGTTAGEVIVLDVLSVEGTGAVTVDASQTSEFNAAHSSSTFVTTVSSEVATGGGGPQTIPMALASETNSAPAMAAAFAQTIAMASVDELDTAFAMTVGNGRILELDAVTERDLALPMTMAQAPVAGGGSFGEIGHWRDSAGSQIPGTSFAGHAFATEVRNDGIYTSLGSGSFRFDEAGNYLIIATIKYEDTSNGRFTSQAAADFTTTGGSFWTSGAGGYSRDTSEDTSWCKVVAYIHGAAANDEVQIVTRRDIDAPTGGSVVNGSDVQIVRIAAEAVGIYGQPTVLQTFAGTTPVDVDLGPTVLESDTAKIERSVQTVTMKTSGARYLVVSSVPLDGASTRTQRWSLHSYTNGPSNSPRSYCYLRNSSNNRAGTIIVDVVEHNGVSDPTVKVQCYRGDGVAAGDGGADVDGGAFVSNLVSMGNIPLGGLLVIELPSSVEVWRSHDTAGSQDLTASPTTITMGGSVHVNDATAFTASGNGFRAEKAMDALVIGNVGTARQNVSSGARWTAYGEVAIGGTAQAVGQHGNYSRGNQGTIDTFGWSVTPGAIYTLASLDVLTAVVTELAGGEAGGTDQTNAGWSHFVALNLDSFGGGVGSPGLTIVGMQTLRELDSAFAMTVDAGGGGQTVILDVVNEQNTAFAVTSVPGAVANILDAVNEQDTAFAMTVALGGRNIPLDVVNEQDTAFAMTALTGPVNALLDLTSEINTAQAMTVSLGALTNILDVVNEADTAFAMTVSLATVVVLDVVNEQDSAPVVTPVLGALTNILDVVNEADTAFAMTVSLATVVVLDVVNEQDTAFAMTALTGPVVVALPLVSEVDTAYAMNVVSGGTIVVLDVVNEVDTALAMTVVSGGTNVPLAVASEADTAFAFTVVTGPVSVPLALAGEVDAALGLTVQLGAFSALLGLPLEADEAFPMSIVTGPTTRVLDLVSETDTAHPLGVSAGDSTIPLATLLEADTAFAMTIAADQVVALDLVSELDTAFATTAVTGPLVTPLGLVSELDTALAMTAVVGELGAPLDLASELDNALTISTGFSATDILLPLVAETDAAFSTGIQLGPNIIAVDTALEADTAFDMTIATGETFRLLDVAAEADTAHDFSLGLFITVPVDHVSEQDGAFDMTVELGTVTVQLGLLLEEDLALQTLALSGLRMTGTLLAPFDIPPVDDRFAVGTPSTLLNLTVVDPDRVYAAGPEESTTLPALLPDGATQYAVGVAGINGALIVPPEDPS